MLTNSQVTVKWLVYYKDDAGKGVKTIERETQENIQLQVPDSIQGLLANLKWSEDLRLVLKIDCLVGIDKFVPGPEKKSLLSRLHF